MEDEGRVNEPLVVKFGGTSVGDGASIKRAAEIVAGAASEDRPVAVVVSAMAGTTDTLLGYAEATATNSTRTATGATYEGSVVELHRTLAARHLEAAREAVCGGHYPKVEERVLKLLRGLVEAIAAPFDDPDARRAEVAVYGERLSAEVLAGAIQGAGKLASVVSPDPIATDAGFAEAEVDAERTRARCGRYVRPLLDGGVVAVVPGYAGRSLEEKQTTLGRGGSDLSATVLGRALGSREAWILTDVSGVLDADPRLVPGARPLPQLSYREAGTFAELGAKVLHHRTVEPAAGINMQVRVLNTFDPENPGTLVCGEERGPGVRCVALQRGISVSGSPKSADAPADPAEDVFCVVGDEWDGPRILEKDEWGGVAAVVCVGSPGREDLSRGLESLEGVDIGPVAAGFCPSGLVFAVPVGDADEALRTLHRALIVESGVGLVAGGAV